MTKILHLDASGRPGLGGVPPLGLYGSFSRRLSQHFIDQWLAKQPNAEIKYRDLGENPPTPVNHAWIEAAFAPEQTAEHKKALAESDELVDELLWADMVVIGVSMYNFNVPANFKAWIDNVVRVGRTILPVENPAAGEHALHPVFKGKNLPVLLLSARGDHGMDPGGEFEHINHLDPSVKTALGFIGIDEIHSIAIENTAVGGEALDKSVEQALAKVNAVAEMLLSRAEQTSEEDKVSNTIQTFFDALAVEDFARFRTLTTEDMDAYDLGHHLNREQIIGFIQSVHAEGKKFDWNVSEPKAHIIGDKAWITYLNKGALYVGNDKQAKTWLESAVLEKHHGDWKVRFLHSTEAAS